MISSILSLFFMLRRKNRLPNPVSFNSNNLEQKSHTDHVYVSKLCLYATGSSGSAFLLSFACTPKLWKKQSHESTLASTFSFVAYCEPLPMNLCLIFASLKLLGGGHCSCDCPPLLCFTLLFVIAFLSFVFFLLYLSILFLSCFLSIQSPFRFLQVMICYTPLGYGLISVTVSLLI